MPKSANDLDAMRAQKKKRRERPKEQWQYINYNIATEIKRKPHNCFESLRLFLLI